MPLTTANHFVPQLYLKHFSVNGRIQLYRFLVSRDTVPYWKCVGTAGTGYERHLYTRVAFGQETDEIENWLNRDFEMPAEAVINRATSDKRLSKNDWYILVRFLACQTVRTPAFFIRYLPRWNKMMPDVMAKVLEDAKAELEAARESGIPPEREAVPNSEYFPIRVIREDVPEKKLVNLRTEVVVGRGLWIYTMKHLLSRALDCLHEHRWTILLAPDGLEWFTSDDPVLQLNYNSESNYDFEGGWRKQGTELMLPLSPRHLLYTQVGKRVPIRGTVLPLETALSIRKMIARHAHRQIFSANPDPLIPQLRPRVVDAAKVDQERDQRRRWHTEQTEAELPVAQQ